MHDSPLHLAVIIGSTREGRLGSTVAHWFAGHAAARSDVLVDVVDLAEVDLPLAYPNELSESLAGYAARIDRADAYVIVTPEYNHGYPASLKQAIDIPHAEWRRKVAGFVSYGGVSGGLRAVEQLRLVLAELHVATVRDSVSFPMAWAAFDGGVLRDPDGPDQAARVLLDELVWWGRALRAARQADAAVGSPADADVA